MLQAGVAAAADGERGGGEERERELGGHAEWDGWACCSESQSLFFMQKQGNVGKTKMQQGNVEMIFCKFDNFFHQNSKNCDFRACSCKSYLCFAYATVLNGERAKFGP